MSHHGHVTQQQCGNDVCVCGSSNGQPITPVSRLAQSQREMLIPLICGAGGGRRVGCWAGLLGMALLLLPVQSRASKYLIGQEANSGAYEVHFDEDMMHCACPLPH